MSKTCNGCGTDKKPSSVPYQVLEDFKGLTNATIKKLWIAIIVLIFLLVGSNIAWLVYESQFEYVETTEEIIVDAEDNGIANYIGKDGDIYNGEDYSQENN